MSHQVLFTREILDAFINEAMLTEDEAFILRTRVNGWSRQQFAALEKQQLEQTINAQQNQINQLQLQTQLCGVVRYPTATTYTTGFNPFCNCNAGCGNI